MITTTQLIDAPDDHAAMLIVAIAPHRGLVRELDANGESLEPIPGSRHELFVGKVGAAHGTRVSLTLRSMGEPGRVDRWLYADSGASLDEAVTATVRALDEDMAALLQRRSGVADYPRFRNAATAVRFFMRFDAWTYPTVANCMRDCGFRRNLERAVFDFFCAEIDPDLAPDSNTIVDVMVGLFGYVETRSKQAHRPCVAGAPPTYRAGVNGCWDRQVETIARFLENVFDSCYPPQSANGAVSKELENAFIAFTTGRFRHVRASDHDVSTLNAEPNSANLLYFVELCLQACMLRSERQEYWFSLARMFTVLIDPFCATYGDPAKPRGFDNYLREYRRPEPLIPVTAVQYRLEMERARMPDARHLSQLEQRAGVELLWALYDEVVRR